MNQSDQLYQLGMRAWEYRRQNGFSKALPKEIRIEAALLAEGGAVHSELAKTLGVTKATIVEWQKSYSKSPVEANRAGFSEVAVVEERSAFEVKLSAKVQGCRVELTGSDFSLLQRLLRKLGP